MIPPHNNSTTLLALKESDTTAIEFARDVLLGLSSEEKSLPSKYFYNDKGSKLFQQIMHLDEYYLTRSEQEIFTTQKDSIFSVFSHEANAIDIAELGAGDGAKTKVLLQYLNEKKFPFCYTAIDISAKALQELNTTVKKELPATPVRLIEAEYLEGLAQLKPKAGVRKVMLFLGSNIGNFTPEQSDSFLTGLRNTIKPGDLLMTGFDLDKDPAVILEAYNDNSGITKAFNLNLLSRINETLDSDFVLSQFEHVPVYDVQKKEARSYIRSKIAQEVHFRKTGARFSFAPGELIHTEISRKYSLEQIDSMAANNGFTVVRNLFDKKKYFCDSIWSAC